MGVSPLRSELRDVEDLLAERGVIVSYEMIRIWVAKFGAHFAVKIRPDRPGPPDRWRLDEVVLKINGVRHWLWRAIDANGDVLDILVQSRRNTTAARRFMRKLFKRWGLPRVMVTEREKIMGRFKSPRHAQRFLSVHDQTAAIFRPRRHRLSARSYHHARQDAFDIRAAYTTELSA